MQNQRAGDVLDFGKIGLLNALAAPEGGQEPLKLAVVWFLNADSPSPDARRDEYLEPDNPTGRRLRRCNPWLAEALEPVTRSRRRSVTLLQESGVLPPGTTFHQERLDMGNGSRKEKTKFRGTWMNRALESCAGADLVFLDPDAGASDKESGIDPQRVHQAELQAFLERGPTLVIHHRMSPRSHVRKQAHRMQREIYERNHRRAAVMRYRHHRPPRGFIIIPGTGHREVVSYRLRRMLETNWKNHFDLLG